MNHPSDSDLLTVEEVSARLRVNVDTVRRMCRTGRLDYVRVARRMLVPRERLDSLIEAGANRPAPRGPRRPR